mmetsp:Transcript_47787/g.133231  ORF Transcript_47787/g.133231 Transcript_47787/m.133231 type:complete len:200 (+) Transcript_47787:1117-1716(+)
MAVTALRCRRCSRMERPVLMPAAIEVPPPARRRSTATLASFFPAASIRRRRSTLVAALLNATTLTRSEGPAWSTTKRTALCTCWSFCPLMEPLTSRMQTKSMGWRCASCASSGFSGPGAAPACTVTRPKTSCDFPTGSAEYSTRALSDTMPSALTSGSGSAAASGAAAAGRASIGSSSAKSPAASGRPTPLVPVRVERG